MREVLSTTRGRARRRGIFAEGEEHVAAVGPGRVQIQQHERGEGLALAFPLAEQAQALVAGGGAADRVRHTGAADGLEHGVEILVGILHDEQEAGCDRFHGADSGAPERAK